jgi:hypothetical protein
MHFSILILLSDFMQVLNRIKKHPARIAHFSKRILFSTIYLLQEQKLNHSKYSEQELIMSNFIQATKHYVHMYAKFGDLTLFMNFCN